MTDEPTNTPSMMEQWRGDRARLLMRMPFLGLLAMQLELRVGEWQSIPTAATDGRTVFGNAGFLAGLSDEERLFVLAHEVWHCAALHPLRQADREPKRWNVAVDQETNTVLAGAGLTVPDGAVFMRGLTGMNAESVYERLPNPPPERGPWADIHDAQGPDWPGAEWQPDTSNDAWQEWPRRVRAALQQSGLTAGTLPGAMARSIAPVLQPKPPPWQRILRKLVGRQLAEAPQWSRPNRRHLAHGRWLPGRPREHAEIAVALDTSGSPQDALATFLGELQRILRAHGPEMPVRLITFDAAVRQDVLVTAADLPRSLPRLTGGGGTDFGVIVRHLARRPPDALIFLTDGRGPADERRPPYPVAWAISDGNPLRDGFRLRMGWENGPERRREHSSPAHARPAARERVSATDLRRMLSHADDNV